MYTHLLLISTVQIPRAYCSFFLSYYIYCIRTSVFVIFYEFEQTCSNVQFIPSPIEVREFLLQLLNSPYCRVSRSIFTLPASHMILSNTDASSSSYHNLFQPVKYLLYTVLSIRDIFSLLSAVMLFRHSYSI